jgi:hypothetical protein
MQIAYKYQSSQVSFLSSYTGAPDEATFRQRVTGVFQMPTVAIIVPFEMLERNCPDEELLFVVPMALSWITVNHLLFNKKCQGS